MPGWLRQSTAQTATIGPFISDTDFKTVQTGLSLAASDFTICKNSASYAAKNDSTAGGNHVNGMYNMTLDATDTASTGRLDVMVQKTGCLVVWDSFMVLSATVYDALFSTGALLTNVTHWSGTAVATPDTAGYPKVTIKDGTGRASSTSPAASSWRRITRAPTSPPPRRAQRSRPRRTTSPAIQPISRSSPRRSPRWRTCPPPR